VSRLDLSRSHNPPLGEATDVDTIVRTILLAAVFLLLWISFKPFISLAEPPELTEAGNVANQVGYSLLLLLLLGWAVTHQPARLKLLLRPILIGSLLWCGLSVLTSWEPALSGRRFAFMLITLSIAAIAMLLPKNVRHFSNVLAAVVLIVLALCYFGVVFIPTLSIHQATDNIEPGLAGDWRGLFGHKNDASAAMAVFIFIGLFIARARSRGLGWIIIALATIFLFFTKSKTSIAVVPVVLVISALMARTPRPIVGVAIALSVLGILSILSVGSVYSETVRGVLDLLLTDSTFTGRDDVWRFAADHLVQRPITGFGFASFWGTPEVVYGMGGYALWAANAPHAHNGYLDLALTVGIPGTVLVTLWLVVLPLVDFYRTPNDRPEASALETLFLRVCLFAAYGSCFESLLLQEGGAALFLFVATFGLRFLTMSQVRT
jgi:O-antigen ligase